MQNDVNDGKQGAVLPARHQAQRLICGAGFILTAPAQVYLLRDSVGTCNSKSNRVRPVNTLKLGHLTRSLQFSALKLFEKGSWHTGTFSQSART